MRKRLQNSRTFNSIIKEEQADALMRAAGQHFASNPQLGYTQEDLKVIREDLRSIVILANQILAFDHVKDQFVEAISNV